MNITQLAEIVKKAKQEGWSYPKTFEALKEAGVESYEVSVAYRRALYKSGTIEWHEPTAELTPLKIKREFSRKKVIAAIHRHQKDKTEYLDFLEDIASAGVDKYVVNMQERTIIYSGIEETDFYQERIP